MAWFKKKKTFLKCNNESKLSSDVWERLNLRWHDIVFIYSVSRTEWITFQNAFGHHQQMRRTITDWFPVKSTCVKLETCHHDKQEWSINTRFPSLATWRRALVVVMMALGKLCNVWHFGKRIHYHPPPPPAQYTHHSLIRKGRSLFQSALSNRPCDAETPMLRSQGCAGMATSTRLHFHYFIGVRDTSLVSTVLSSITLNRQPFFMSVLVPQMVSAGTVSTPSSPCYIRGGWYLLLNADLFLVFHFWFCTTFIGTNPK